MLALHRVHRLLLFLTILRYRYALRGERTDDGGNGSAAVPVGLFQMGFEEILNATIEYHAGGHIALENIAEIDCGLVGTPGLAVAFPGLGRLVLRGRLARCDRIRKEKAEEPKSKACQP